MGVLDLGSCNFGMILINTNFHKRLKNLEDSDLITYFTVLVQFGSGLINL